MTPTKSKSHELLIGLEVHTRLDTGGKLFCGCRLPFDANREDFKPNSAICETCIGHPGAMPRLQPSGIHYGLALAIALGARPMDLLGSSRFERKHYFYWDLPKNYQITQITAPLCRSTLIQVPKLEGGSFEIYLNRIHMEEDAARKQEDQREIRVDFNRSGTVLAEIVTEPDFRSPEQAADFLRYLRKTLQWHNLGSGEVGDLRCDINMSVREKGETELPKWKVELKNLTAFDSLAPIVAREEERLAQKLRAGETIGQETREWDPDRQETKRLRSKEGASEYWYYVEPDLLDIEVTEAEVETAQALLHPPVQEVEERLSKTGFNADEMHAFFADPDHGFLVNHASSRGLDLRSCRALSDLLKEAARTLDESRRPEKLCPSTEADPSSPAWSSRDTSFRAFWSQVQPNLDQVIDAALADKLNPQQIRLLTIEHLVRAEPWKSIDDLLAAAGIEESLGSDEMAGQIEEMLFSIRSESEKNQEIWKAWLAEGDKKLFNFFQGQLMRRLPKGTDGRAVREILVQVRDRHAAG